MATAKEDKVIKTVKMDDDRVVEFTGKRKMLKESLLGENSTQVRMDFANGETRTFTIPPQLMQKFAAHGAEQKLGDEIAGMESIEDCVIAIDALMERLELGEWAVKREANGMAGISILARALQEVSGKPIEEVKKFLFTRTAAEKMAFRLHASIKPVIARLEAEKLALKGSDVDADAQLSELGIAA